MLSLNRLSNGKRGARGVAMVEFSAVAIILFMLTGAIIDVGIVIHRWSEIGAVVSDFVRAQASSRGATVCPDLAYVNSRLRNELAGIPGMHPESIEKITVTLSRGTNVILPTLRVSAQVAIPCFFCMMLPDRKVALVSRGEAMLELGARSGSSCPEAEVET